MFSMYHSGPQVAGPFGVPTARLLTSVVVPANTTVALHTLSFAAGSGKRFRVEGSADASPNDGTTSGYRYGLDARVRRTGAGVYVIDGQQYNPNLEQTSTADMLLATTGGGTVLVVNGTAPPGASMTFTLCDVFQF